jgi:hypothetical protein
MKSAVLWDIKPQFLLHRKHITSLLQSPTGQCYVRFEALTEVTMKNAVFWNVAPCGLQNGRSEEYVSSSRNEYQKHKNNISGE